MGVNPPPKGAPFYTFFLATGAKPPPEGTHFPPPNLWNQGTKSLLKKASKILFPFYKREPEPLLNRGFTGALPPCWSKSAVGGLTGVYPREKWISKSEFGSLLR